MNLKKPPMGSRNLFMSELLKVNELKRGMR